MPSLASSDPSMGTKRASVGVEVGVFCGASFCFLNKERSSSFGQVYFFI